MNNSYKLEVWPRYFVIRNPDYELSEILNNYCNKRLIKYEKVKDPNSGRFIEVPESSYYFAKDDGREYRIPIDMFKDFKMLLESYGKASEFNGSTIEYGYNESMVANIIINPYWILKDFQEDYYDWVKNLTGPSLNDFPPGKGKTITSMVCLSRFGERAMLLMAPRLMSKWKADLLGSDEKPAIIDSEQTKLIIIDTVKSLIRLLETKEGFDIVLMSSTIFRMYLRDYRTLTQKQFNEIYAVKPGELTTILGIGSVLIDEVHEQFNANFIASLFLPTKHYIGLSGSLVPNGSLFLSAFQRYYFRLTHRYGKIKPDKFITVAAIWYPLHQANSFKVKLRGMYNHIQFEKNILKRKHHLADYLSMINYYVVNIFLKNKKDKETCLIYVASVDLATVLTKHLSQLHPTLDIRRYAESDPYENVIKPDIRVTTPGKCRSAIDIPKLTTIIATNAINADSSNIQMLGRGRELTDSEVCYIYFVCEDIPTHIKYHKDKVMLYPDRVKSLNSYRYGKTIGK